MIRPGAGFPFHPKTRASRAPAPPKASPGDPKKRGPKRTGKPRPAPAIGDILANRRSGYTHLAHRSSRSGVLWGT